MSRQGSSEQDTRRSGPGEGRTDPGGGLHPAASWILLDAGRWTLIGVFSVVVFVVLFALGALGVVGVTDADLVSSVFASAITGVFTLVSVTTSINQLVLSRVIGSPDMIRDRMESVRQFRTTVEDQRADVAVSPTNPAAFLRVVVRGLRDRTDELRTAFDGRHHPRYRRDVEDLVGTLDTLTERVEDHLDDDRMSLFAVLRPILDNRYSAHLNTARRIEANASDLTDAQRRAIESLIEALERMNRTRHYFKTLYLHVELVHFSRNMLVTGPPALVVSFVTVFAYENGATVGGDLVLLLLVSAAMAVVLAPFAVLFAYGLRIATIAKRTTTYGTFTPIEEMP